VNFQVIAELNSHIVGFGTLYLVGGYDCFGRTHCVRLQARRIWKSRQYDLPNKHWSQRIRCG